MRIAYCDDEVTQSIYLRELTDQWEREGNPRCDITAYASAEEMLFENPVSFPFDLILLDIRMDKMNGIELARAIRKIDQQVILAFLTNDRQYALEGYEVLAARYLIKPLTKEHLFPLLSFVMQRTDMDKQYIIVGKAADKIKLDTEDIHYVEAMGHYVNIHTDHTLYEVKMNINDIAGQLGPQFTFTHRSFLVNLHYIERITKTDCIMKGNIPVPISRNSYKEVNQAFINYYKGGGF